MALNNKIPYGIMQYKKIPKERTRNSQYIDWVLILVFLSIAMFRAENCTNFWLIASILLLAIIFIELIKRFCMFLEETHHLVSRYDGNLCQLLDDTFTFSRPAVVTFFSSLIVLISCSDQFSNISKEDFWCTCFVFLAICVLLPYLKLNQSPLYESIQISNMNGLDVGVGMANSYFHGYLKILLPADGINNRGIKYFMEVYEENESITFFNKALYILIPLSLNCPARLTDVSTNMEEAQNLLAMEIDRGGVRKRNYKNSVYKINCQYGENVGTIYLSAEYASPLKTFSEIINSKNKYAHCYNKHKKEILWQFYTTLLELVQNDDSTRGLCEVIYFDDKNEEGKLIDIKDVLLKKIIYDKKKCS